MRQIKSGSALNLEIRLAMERDLPAILELEKNCFKEETFKKRQIEYLLKKARSLVLVALLDGKLVGSIIILLRKHISNARIYSLNVHPLYRRIGVGGSLMDSSEKRLVNMGFRNFTLETGVNNIAAMNLYTSKGYQVKRKILKYYRNGKDAFRLIKKL